MLFNTLEFVVFFVAVLATIAIIKNRSFQHLFLILASYFFFYFSSNYLLSLLIISTILDYYVGKYIWKTDNLFKKKVLLVVSLVGNLGLLGFFKYADFAIAQFNILGNYINLADSIPFLNLALPIGISFYTFQTISYTVDIYRGKLEPSKSFKEFALFVCFFPQLVAGPILRANQFLPQLRKKLESFETGSRIRQIQISSSNLKFGITMMAFGFFKKMFIADNIAPFVNEVFANPIGANSFEIWLGTIAFGIQIYCDFSGYSDIAIGAAILLGFKIPLNFNKPYFATSPSDFWKRWHISLSSWLRDYLYIPLGGNQKSKMSTYANLFIVMILGGLWHGASVNFIIWGMLHGVYLAIHKILKERFANSTIIQFFQTRLGKIVAIMITQYFVFLAWIPFRVQETDAMVYSLLKFVFFDFQLMGFGDFIMTHKFPFFIMGIFLIIHFISYFKGDLIKSVYDLPIKYWWVFLTFTVVSILFFFDGNPEDFIYFRF